MRTASGSRRTLRYRPAVILDASRGLRGPTELPRAFSLAFLLSK